MPGTEPPPGERDHSVTVRSAGEGPVRPRAHRRAGAAGPPISPHLTDAECRLREEVQRFVQWLHDRIERLDRGDAEPSREEVQRFVVALAGCAETAAMFLPEDGYWQWLHDRIERLDRGDAEPGRRDPLIDPPPLAILATGAEAIDLPRMPAMDGEVAI